MRAKLSQGVLLVGPLALGKHFFAKAVAGESDVPFLSICGSNFRELFVGVGPSRVRSLFADSRQCAPSIIFIGEIDAVGAARRGFSTSENTLNQ